MITDMNISDAQNFIDLIITKSTPNSTQWLAAQAAKATVEGLAQELSQIQAQQYETTLAIERLSAQLTRK